MRKNIIFIIDMQSFFSLVWYSPFLKFYFQSISINDLQESTSKMLMDFHCRSNYLICSIIPFISHTNYLCQSIICEICVICG